MKIRRERKRKSCGMSINAKSIIARCISFLISILFYFLNFPHFCAQIRVSCSGSMGLSRARQHRRLTMLPAQGPSEHPWCRRGVGQLDPPQVCRQCTLNISYIHAFARELHSIYYIFTSPAQYCCPSPTTNGLTPPHCSVSHFYFTFLIWLSHHGTFLTILSSQTFCSVLDDCCH